MACTCIHCTTCGFYVLSVRWVDGRPYHVPCAPKVLPDQTISADMVERGARALAERAGDDIWAFGPLAKSSGDRLRAAEEYREDARAILGAALASDEETR